MSDIDSQIRRWLLVAAVLWLMFLLANHVLDNRQFSEDPAHNIGKALNWVDHGDFAWRGSYFYKQYRLGPLAHVLAALPMTLSRNIYAQYYFLSFLMVLAVLVYGLGAWRLFRRPFPVAVAVVAFAYLVFLLYQPLKPHNASYCPFFLGLYFFSLVVAQEKRSWWIILPFVVVGFLVQLHLSCGLLLATTLIALRVWQKPSWIMWSLFGLVLAAAINFMVIAQLFDPPPVSASLPPLSAAALVKGYFSRLVYWLTVFPIRFGFGGLLILFCLLRLRRLRTVSTDYAALVDAMLFHLGAGIVVFPLLNTLKDNYQLEYMNPIIVFSAFLVGLYALERQGREERPTKQTVRLLVIFVAALMFTQALFTLIGVHSLKRFNSMNLRTQVGIAQRLTDYFQAQSERFFLRTFYFTVADEQVQLGYESLYVYRNLCLYEDPALYTRFTDGFIDFVDQPEAFVVVAPAQLPRADFDGIIGNRARVLISPFTVGRRQASLIAPPEDPPWFWLAKPEEAQQ